METTFLRVRRTAQPVYVGTFVLIRFAPSDLLSY